MESSSAACLVALAKTPAQRRPERLPRTFRSLSLVGMVLLTCASPAWAAGARRQVDIDCLRVDLTHQATHKQLFWVNSGTWISRDGEERLLLLDPVFPRVAEITVPSAHQQGGIVRVLSEEELRDALRNAGIETPMLLRSMPGADKAVFELSSGLVQFDTTIQPGGKLSLRQHLWPILPAGQLSARDRRGGTLWARPIAGQVSGRDLVVDTLWNWQLTSNGLFAYADLCEGRCDPHVQDGWVSTFIHDSFATSEKVVIFDLSIGFSDDIRQFYIENRDYLALLDHSAYLLDFTQGPPRFVRMSISPAGTAELQSLPDFPRFNARLDLDGIMRVRAPQIATDYYRRIQAQAIPTALYAWNGLYLLAKDKIDSQGETRWWLTRVDPDTGTALSEVKLPSTAANLALVPGRYWALVEKSEIEGRGERQFPFMQTRSVVLLPDAQLTGSLQASLQGAVELVCRPPR